MAEFSKNERKIARLLGTSPRLKRVVKFIYAYTNYFLFGLLKKRIISSYKIRVINDWLPQEWICCETFFGYYDKCPMVADRFLLVHASAFSTRKLPSANQEIYVLLLDLQERTDNRVLMAIKVKAYNWQQGCRSQWLTDDLFIVNDYDVNHSHYYSRVFSKSERREVKSFAYPVQDAFHTNYFLSLNYQRIQALRPDYGYCNMSGLEVGKLKETKTDGIGYMDYKTSVYHLLFSLQDIIDCNYKEVFKDCLHKVNHIMIRPDGKGFIFIHRYYQGKKRFDRLFYSDFKSLEVLVDYGMVSHCCWVNNSKIIGYFRIGNKDDFYCYDFLTRKISLCKEIACLMTGDGHPSCYKDWIVFDSYPDKSRMQKLFLYNMCSGKIILLLEVYHSLYFMNQTRSDLHPRFSLDGKFVFFDSVFSGKRQLCYIDVSSIIN